MRAPPPSHGSLHALERRQHPGATFELQMRLMQNTAFMYIFAYLPILADSGRRRHPADVTSVVTEHTRDRYWRSPCENIVEPVVADALPGVAIGLGAMVHSAWHYYSCWAISQEKTGVGNYLSASGTISMLTDGIPSVRSLVSGLWCCGSFGNSWLHCLSHAIQR